MALLLKNLVKVYVFSSEENEDVYVGTETVDVYSHTIDAVVQPADSRKTAEVYGERTSNMFSILCHKSTVLNADFKVSFKGTDKPTHKIVSEKEYSSHKVLIAEAVI